MPSRPVSPPWLRLGSGQSASGLQHAYSNTLSNLTATNAANGWKHIGRISKDTHTTDIKTPGSYTLNNVTLNLVKPFGTINTFQQTTEGIEFDIAASTTVFINVVVSSLAPAYQLGHRLRCVIKFKGDAIPDISSSGNDAQIAAGYATGNLATIIGSTNRVVGGVVKRQTFGGPFGVFTFSTGTTITTEDQVIAIQGAHPGWQGFYTETCDQDTPPWSTLTPVDGICTPEGDPLLPDGAGTDYDASTDVLGLAIIAAAGAGISGTIEYFDFYWLDDGES